MLYIFQKEGTQVKHFLSNIFFHTGICPCPLITQPFPSSPSSHTKPVYIPITPSCLATCRHALLSLFYAMSLPHIVILTTSQERALLIMHSQATHQASLQGTNRQTGIYRYFLLSGFVTLPSLISRQGLIDFSLSVYATLYPYTLRLLCTITHAHKYISGHIGIMRCVSYDLEAV